MKAHWTVMGPVAILCAGLGSAQAFAAEVGMASAAEIAARQRGPVQCPPPAAGASPAQDGAVDDVQGVRPGMAYDLAANLVLCSHPMLVVSPRNERGVRANTHGQKVRLAFEARFAEPEKTSQQIIDDMRQGAMNRGTNRLVADLQPGQSRWFVSTFGAPGQERVLHVARRERFSSDKAPAIEALEQALTAKYGPPTIHRRAQAGQQATFDMYWAIASSGRRIPPNGQLDAACASAPNSPDSPMNYRSGCGLSIQAFATSLPGNPGIIEYLNVSIVRPDLAMQILSDTESALSRTEASRQARELEEARKRAPAVKL